MNHTGPRNFSLRDKKFFRYFLHNLPLQKFSTAVSMLEIFVLLIHYSHSPVTHLWWTFCETGFANLKLYSYYLTKKKLAEMPALLHQRKANVRSRKSREVQEVNCRWVCMIWEAQKGNTFKNYSKLRFAWSQLKRFHIVHCLVHSNLIFCWNKSLLVVSWHSLTFNWATKPSGLELKSVKAAQQVASISRRATSHNSFSDRKQRQQ